MANYYKGTYMYKNMFLWNYSPCIEIYPNFKIFLKHILEPKSCCPENHLKVIELTRNSMNSIIPQPVMYTDPEDSETVFDNFIICLCQRCYLFYPDSLQFGCLLLEKMHHPLTWIELGKVTISIDIEIIGHFIAKFLIHHKRKKIYIICKGVSGKFTYPVPIGYDTTLHKYFVSCKARAVPTLGNICRHFILLTYPKHIYNKFLPQRECDNLIDMRLTLQCFEIETFAAFVFATIEDILHAKKKFIPTAKLVDW